MLTVSYNNDTALSLVHYIHTYTHIYIIYIYIYTYIRDIKIVYSHIIADEDIDTFLLYYYY